MRYRIGSGYRYEQSVKAEAEIKNEEPMNELSKRLAEELDVLIVWTGEGLRQQIDYELTAKRILEWLKEEQQCIEWLKKGK